MNLMKTTPLVGVLALMAAVAVAAPALEEQYRQASADFYKADKAEALKKLLPLAEQGHAGAQQKVAVLYLGGGGVAKDLKQVAKWYGKAAEAGSLDAQFQLATAYREGLHGLPKDHALALKWFRAAADQGYAAANLSLAVMHQNGWGTEKNLPESFRLASLAANQHNADAQVHVGRMYEKGEGVAQSHTEAAKWYRKAADLGSYMAQQYLKALPATSAATPVAAPVVMAAAAAPAIKPVDVVSPPPEARKPVPSQAPALVHTPITDPARFLEERNRQAAASAVAPVSDSSFNLDKAPVAERGKSTPIVAGKPEYGFKYTDQQGLYTFVLATGWSWETDKADPRAVDFWGKSGANVVSCGVTPMDYWRGPKSLVELQAVPENVARATFERGLFESLDWKAADSRDALVISDGRSPVRAWSWSAAAPDGKNHDTVAVVETPANALMVLCTSNKPKLPGAVIKLAFRLAEGALVPANAPPTKPAATVTATNTAQGTLAEALRLEEQGNHAKAFAIYKALADKGDAQAQFKLGIAYGVGRGVAKDKAQEVAWYRKSAEQGYADAQGLLGTYYMSGEGVPLDKTQAYMWLRLAAPADTLYEYNRSVLALQLSVAELDKAEKLATACKAQQFKSCGVASTTVSAGQQPAVPASQQVQQNEFQRGLSAYNKDDFAQAMALWKPLAEQGLASVQYNIAVMHSGGKGVAKDDAVAAQWYRKAADQGYLDAQFNLGVLLQNGQGVAKDPAEALFWFQKAAEKGHAKSQFNLGLAHHQGNGTTQNHSEAFKWFRKAAEQGHATAQWKLAGLYEFGNGVAKDLVAAYMWLSLAEEPGMKSIFDVRLANLGKRLTPVQLDKAKGMAVGCKAKNFKACDPL